MSGDLHRSVVWACTMAVHHMSLVMPSFLHTVSATRDLWEINEKYRVKIQSATRLNVAKDTSVCHPVLFCSVSVVCQSLVPAGYVWTHYL